ADRNRSHWSTSKTPSYTKSVSWQHHPMLNVNPDTLTGVYLGARFDRKDLHSEDLYKFKNLGCNIYSCELSDIDFSLKFNKVEF
ncbi:hypothetical protein NP011_16680, partial [Salmonella enterica]|nr:hypothetical protein [Salmonella enterica]